MPEVGARQVLRVIEDALIQQGSGDIKVYITTGVGQLRPATGVDIVVMRDEVNVPILVIESIEGK